MAYAYIGTFTTMAVFRAPEITGGVKFVSTVSINCAVIRTIIGHNF